MASEQKESLDLFEEKDKETQMEEDEVEMQTEEIAETPSKIDENAEKSQENIEENSEKIEENTEINESITENSENIEENTEINQSITENSENIEENTEINESITENSENKDPNVESKEQPKPKEEKFFQFPLGRVKNIMKMDPDLNLVSGDAVFLITKSLELFVESLAIEAYSYTSQAKKKTISKQDVEKAIDAVDALAFLDGALDD